MKKNISRSIYGAWCLARLDPRGMTFFDLSNDGFWASFVAIIVVIPFFLATVAIQLSVHDPDFAPLRDLPLHLVSHVVSWALFVLAAIPLTRIMGVAENYVRYVIAYNWAHVIAMVGLLIGNILANTGIISAALGTSLLFIIIAAIFVYFWFVARVALNANATAATGLVVLDWLLGFLVDGVFGLWFVAPPGVTGG